MSPEEKRMAAIIKKAERRRAILYEGDPMAELIRAAAGKPANESGLVTQRRWRVRIFAVDLKNASHPVAGAYTLCGEEKLGTWGLNGRWNADHSEGHMGLIPAQEGEEGRA